MAAPHELGLGLEIAPGAAYLTHSERNDSVLRGIQLAHERAVAAEVFEPFRTFEIDPNPVGYMDLGKSALVAVARTRRNDLFFNFDAKSGTYKLSRQNLFHIESTIQTAEQSRDKVRTWALFDTKGTFQDMLNLEEVYRSSPNEPAVSVIFSRQGPSGNKIALPAYTPQDIYCIAGAQVPLVSWDVDHS